jgi:hypothetical protein
MHRIVFAFLCSGVLACLALIATPASAGDYYGGGGYYGDSYRGYGDGYYRSRYSGNGYYRSRYSDDGYYRPRHRNVWYSSNCCYRKLVRHERSVRYVREDYGYRSSYYDGGYSRRSYRSGYYERPSYRQRYYSDYYQRPYRSYRYSNAGYLSYDNCYGGRVRVADGRGGWVWGRRVCY